MNSVESTKFVKYFCKKWVSNQPPLTEETEMIPQSHEDTGNREDFWIKPNSGFSVFLDSAESREYVFMSEKLKLKRIPICFARNLQ